MDLVTVVTIDQLAMLSDSELFLLHTQNIQRNFDKVRTSVYAVSAP